MYSKSAPRRRHSAGLRIKVLAACDEPGASVAAVALAHGLNANLVHKWRRLRDAGRLSSTGDIVPVKPDQVLPPAAAAATGPTSPTAGAVVTTPPRSATKCMPTDAATTFVPLRLENPNAAATDIRLELRRGAATAIVTWPAQEAAACGRWLREWLR